MMVPMEVFKKFKQYFLIGAGFFASLLISLPLFAQNNFDPHKVFEEQNQTVIREEVHKIPKHFDQEPVRAPAAKNPDALMCLSPTEMTEKLRTEFKTDRQIRPYITYYLEVRDASPMITVPLYSRPDESYPKLGALHSGQLIKMEETGTEYLQKVRADRKGNVIWRKIVVHQEGSETELYFKYDWRVFHSLSAIDHPFEMTIRPPTNPQFPTVFRKAGPFQAADCLTTADLCAPWPDTYARAYTVDFQWIKSTLLNTRDTWWVLYYKVGLDLIDAKGERKQDYAWFESHSAFRRSDQIPAYLYTTGTPEMTNFLPEDEIRRTQNQLFIFDGNQDNEGQRRRVLASLGINDTKMKGLSSIFDLTLQFETHVGTVASELKQDFVSGSYTMIAPTLGGSISSNLFLDLKMKGSLDLSYTATSNHPEYGAATLVDAQEWFEYVTPWSLNEMPITMGVGGYYIGMLSKDSANGFNSFVGPHSKILVTGKTFGASLRLAPVGTDLNLRVANHLAGAELIYKPGWKVYEEPVSLSFTTMELNYINPKTEHTVAFKQFQFNVNIPMW
jgi:hypothetical protein